MNRIVKTTVLLVFFLVLSTGAVFADPVTNGLFFKESDLINGWVSSEGVTWTPNGYASVGAAQLQIQDYSLNITTITLSQYLTISSPTAIISFDVKFENIVKRDLGTDADGKSNEPGQPNFFQVYLGYETLMAYDKNGQYKVEVDPETSAESFIDISLTPIGDGWFHFSQEIFTGGELAFVLYDRGDEYYSTAWVDNVLLDENVTSVPEPSSIFLLVASIVGFMSAGLISVRRRRV